MQHMQVLKAAKLDSPVLLTPPDNGSEKTKKKKKKRKHASPESQRKLRPSLQHLGRTMRLGVNHGD